MMQLCCDHKKTECKHTKVKYCEKCDKVYCEECGKEWTTISSYTTVTFPDYTGTSKFSQPYFYCRGNGGDGEVVTIL